MLTRDTIYVKVYADRFVLKNMDSSETVEIRRDPQFRSPRMLIGNFTAAEKEFREGLKKVRQGLLAPRVLMHPMELTQGGVTQVESRALIELAAGSGAQKVGVWEGDELGGDRVRKAILEFKDA
ncbi:MAG: hypothetical protein ACREUZ_08515 [Burkholderiales bacterium]